MLKKLRFDNNFFGFGELAIHDNKTVQVFFGALVEKGGSRQLITC